jgi:hypothetical protein
MNSSKPSSFSFDGDSAEVEVYYTTYDTDHEGFELAREIRYAPATHNIGPEDWIAYDFGFGGTVDLSDLPGECSIGVLLSYLYARLQGGRSDDELGYDGTEHRSVSIGDLIVVDGSAYLVDKGHSFRHVGKIDNLRSGSAK